MNMYRLVRLHNILKFVTWMVLPCYHYTGASDLSVGSLNYETSSYVRTVETQINYKAGEKTVSG